MTRAEADPTRFPLIERFPALARIPRAHLTTLPTPVEALLDAAPDGSLWIKRDDLSGPSFGGNKVRALEFLLGDVKPGDTVLTIGGEGSTHVLATAYHAKRLGAATHAIRWRHEMNPMALTVAARASELCADVTTTQTIVGTGVRVLWRRLRSPRTHWVPMGGSSPLGTLGHVNAGLELACQIRDGLLPPPRQVVVPLGTGGTAAGLAVGFAIAGLPIAVIAARIGPRIGANRTRVLRLARATAALIRQTSGERMPDLSRDAVSVVHDVYGGAYGRSLPAGDDAARRLEGWRGIALDATYSAKAFAAAIALHRSREVPTLFWLTFDGRALRGRTA
jgi:1-aminocyclopropane-1-carboxylate deaminase/D-cysteine desulfhydrase-like pyridoxal-dependent ACC family enzyme